MVQYVITPWRDPRELIAVRAQFYPAGRSISELSEQQLREQREAVSRVHMWTLRGGCPHLVESTAALTAAMLSDAEGEGNAYGCCEYTLRLTYSMAFSRFVTGLLDSYQDRAYKISMYGVAKSVGLPASFVELRHETTHEQLPSLNRLRTATGRARGWIWDNFWSSLPVVEYAMEDKFGTEVDANSGACTEEVLRVLEIDKKREAETAMGEVLTTYGQDVVLKVLSDAAEAMTDTKAGLKVTSMIGHALGLKQEDLSADSPSDIEALRLELGEAWDRVRKAGQESALPGSHQREVAKNSLGSSWTLSRERDGLPRGPA